MSEVGWIERALHQGKLKITDNNMCPFCNPEFRADGIAKVNACEEHQWVSEKWFKNRFPSWWKAYQVQNRMKVCKDA